MAKVVNLRKAPYDVYIGRRGKGQSGYWGNPVRIGYECPECGDIHRDGGSTLPCYRQYLLRRIAEDDTFCEKFLQLDGQVLGCFCKPKPCHGDVMVQLLKELLE